MIVKINAIAPLKLKNLTYQTDKKPQFLNDSQNRFYSLRESVLLSPAAIRMGKIPPPRRPYLELDQVEAILKGGADIETANEAFNCFYEKIAVYLKGSQGTQPPELVALYRGFQDNMQKADTPEQRSALIKDIFKTMKKDHPRDFNSFILYRNLGEVSRFLDLKLTQEPLQPRKALFVGGIHGNELSGIINAKKLQEATLTNPRIAVITEANQEACRQGKRRLWDGDLNRMFPGKPEGTLLEKRAAQIYNQAKQCDLVIDFHESKAHWSQGGLGKICIFHPGPQTLKALKGMEPILLEEGFRFGANPFRGELVREISEKENKAAFLLELPRTMSLEDRLELAEKLTKAALSTYKLEEKEKPA